MCLSAILRALRCPPGSEVFRFISRFGAVPGPARGAARSRPSSDPHSRHSLGALSAALTDPKGRTRAGPELICCSRAPRTAAPSVYHRAAAFLPAHGRQRTDGGKGLRGRPCASRFVRGAAARRTANRSVLCEGDGELPSIAHLMALRVQRGGCGDVPARWSPAAPTEQHSSFLLVSLLLKAAKKGLRCRRKKEASSEPAHVEPGGFVLQGVRLKLTWRRQNLLQVTFQHESRPCQKCSQSV